MTLLYDRLAYARAMSPAWAPELVPMSNMLESIGDPGPLVEISNVAEFFYAGTDPVAWSDFPNLAPPFERFWMEYRRPARIPSPHGGMVPTSGGPRAVGVAVRGYEVGTVPADLGPLLARLAGLDEARWCLSLTTFVEVEKGWVLAAPSVSVVGVRADGSATGEVRAVVSRTEEAPDHPGVRFLFGFVKPALLAISFMHCKNVRQAEEAPPPKLSRAHTRRHGLPLSTYRTLVIDPMREVLRREGRAGEVGVERALHICRGHFKTYDQARPLFGRVAGTIWCPSHVRGAIEAGLAGKDYRVLAT